MAAHTSWILSEFVQSKKAIKGRGEGPKLIEKP